jgi:hypothetical protein
MPLRRAIPSSPQFQQLVGHTPYRDQVAICVNAPAPAILDALRGVPLGDRKLARCLERLLSVAADGDERVLHEDTPRERITRSAAGSVTSVRVAPTGRPGEHWLVVEHAMPAQAVEAKNRHFGRCWQVVRPYCAYLTRRRLEAVKRTAEAAPQPVDALDAARAVPTPTGR